MDWMFEDFKTDLDGLNPKVREKALEIAKELVKKKGPASKRCLTRSYYKSRRMVLRYRRIKNLKLKNYVTNIGTYKEKFNCH